VSGVHEPRFADRDAWIAAVEAALARRGANRILAALATDAQTVLTVARAECAEATDGVCVLSHSRIAEATGLPVAAVRRARLALIELRLEDLAAAPGAPGRIQRELRRP
jgi:hypothetical protein